MTSLQKMKEKGINPNIIIETEFMSIRWQIKFPGEAVPEWINCGAGHSEDAAIGIGHVLDSIAERLETLSQFCREQGDEK